jgi:ABC-type Mn2+/Zn2+ transport system ATPase subunit
MKPEQRFRLDSFRLRRFKAVRESGSVKFTPFTLLIGANGSGKSSLIEGLEAAYELFFTDPTHVFQRWRGFEHVFCKRSQTVRKRTRGGEAASHSIEFDLRGRLGKGRFISHLEIQASANFDQVFRAREDFVGPDGKPAHFRASEFTPSDPPSFGWKDDTSPTGEALRRAGQYWQFLNLSPQALGQPYPRTRSPGRVALREDGANLGEYLLELAEKDRDVLTGIIETLAEVLGYGRDLQAVQTSELERVVYLSLTERDFKVPGWLLSTGTLRVVALLAVLRHPQPPALLVVEELENGLDPRTIAVLMETIRQAVEEKRIQVIATTHSPHLLNQALIEHIVLVERDENSEPRFSRPATKKDVQRWAKKFAPGDLYTMNQLHQLKKAGTTPATEGGEWTTLAKKLIK